MNNFTFITPEKYLEIAGGDSRKLSLEELKEIANYNAIPCIVCESEDQWKLAQTGMCFSCTTGEADASNDYELLASEPAPTFCIETYIKRVESIKAQNPEVWGPTNSGKDQEEGEEVPT